MKRSFILLVFIVLCIYKVSLAAVLFEDGFENEAGDNGGGAADFTSGTWTLGFNPENSHICEDLDYVHSGTQSFRSHFIADYVDGANGQIKRYLSSGVREWYVRFYIYIPVTWTWVGISILKFVRNMKDPGEPVETGVPTWYLYMTGDPPENTGSRTDLSLWMTSMCGEYPLGTRGCTNIPIPFQEGEWGYLEQRIKLDDEGQSNGILQIWAAKDGETPQLVLDYAGALFNDDTYLFKHIIIPGNYSAGTVDQAQDLYIDDVAIGTSFIGQTQLQINISGATIVGGEVR